MSYFDQPQYEVTDGNVVYARDLNNPLIELDTGIQSLVSDIQTGANINYVSDTGVADAYVVSLDPAPTAYEEGLGVWLKPSATNTGASTINVNSLGAIDIKRHGLEDLSAGDIAANYFINLKYSNGAFQIVSYNGLARSEADRASDEADRAEVAADVAYITANVVPYVSTTSYVYPDTAIGSNGATYRCISSTPITGVDPVGSTSGEWLQLTTVPYVPEFISFSSLFSGGFN